MEYPHALGIGHTTNATSPMPVVVGMIGEYAGQTEIALTGLHNLLDKLNERLSATLNSPAPSAASSAPTTTPIASAFGERLRAQAIGVQNAAARVEELLNRLDL